MPELNCPKLYDKWGNSTRNTGFIIVFAPILSISIYSLCSKCLNLNQLELADTVHLFCAGYLYNLALTCHKNVLKIMCRPVKKCLEWALLLLRVITSSCWLRSCILKHNTIKSICPPSGAISRLQFNDVIWRHCTDIRTPAKDTYGGYLNCFCLIFIVIRA